jgi:hypothetical protein
MDDLQNMVDRKKMKKPKIKKAGKAFHFGASEQDKDDFKKQKVKKVIPQRKEMEIIRRALVDLYEGKPMSTEFQNYLRQVDELENK